MDKETSEAILEVANAIQRLGNGDAATNMGAIEGIGRVMIDGGKDISSSIDGVANSLNNIAEAINNLAEAISTPKD